MALAGGATNFLQNSLEKCLMRKVEITLLFDFLNGIIHHPSQQSSLSAFITKWRKLFSKSCRKTMIIKYSGTWPPNCLASEELYTQQQWQDFVLRYDPSFSERELVDSENSPDYQPLNFKELIQLSFWKELYETFGHKIVSHIFEKCAVLFEVDEGLYLIAAYSGGLVHQRLSKYEGCAKPAVNKNGALSHISSANPRNPYESIESPCSSAKEKSEKEIQSHPPATDEFRIEDRDPSCGQVESGRYKRKKEDATSTVKVLGNDLNLEEHQPPAKKHKMNVDPPVVSKGRNTSCSSSAPADRWIKPRPEDFNKLIEHRNELLNSYSLNKESSNIPNASLNYIHVLKDEDFKPKNKLFLLKQKAIVSITKPELPRDWKGLKISNDLIKANERKNEILIHVYHISETLARKLGIRLKPKGRSRKKRGSQHDDGSIIVEEEVSTFTSTTVEATATSNKQSTAEHNSSVSPLEVDLGENGASTALITSVAKPSCAFVSNITLPIAACLYNKSSWPRWPISHCLSKAKSEYTSDKASSLRKVVCGILKMQVCSEPAYRYLIQILTETWKDVCDNSISLNDLVFNIIQTHMKFKDIHRLVKSCVRYWRTKYAQKQERKNSRTVPWRETNENKVMNPPEVIEIDSSPTPVPPATEISSESCSGSPMEIVEISQSTSLSVVKMTNNVTALSFTSNPSKGQSNSAPQTMVSTEQRPGNKVAKAKTKSKKKATLIRKSSGNTKKHRPIKSLRHPVPYNCVMQSLKQLFHILKIDTLLGSKNNIRGFFKFVRKAIILGGTKSGLHLGELMALVNPEDSPLAQVCGGDKLATEIFMAKLVTWLFNDYVLVILKMSFYITECSNTRFQMKFFLRELWTSASHKMRTRLLRQHALEQLEQKTFSQQRPNAVIRYIPKANNTLRSLLIRKKTAWSIADGELKMFKLLLYFIDAKISPHRMHLPSTIQNQWRKFCGQWKDMGTPKLYYLRMDIRDAFPSVSPEKLKEILFKLGGDRERQQNVVQKQYALFCGANGKKLIRSSIFDSYCRNNWYSGIHIRPCIALDLNRDKSVNIWKILDNLTTMITSSSTVKIGKKLYDFRYGLPQGWGPSSVLCSIYYGFIDSTLYIPYLETHGRLFFRVVDDYLFITPVASEIVNLTQLIKIGCQKFELKMNEDKSETNIFVRSDVATPETNCEHTVFCGWNFCFTHGHVSRDYQKYKGQDFCSTITFQMLKSINSPEQFIRLRGTLIMPARLKPILMDPSINCSKRILLTVYEASVLLGFRFYALCRVVYPSLSAIKDLERSKVLLESVRICCARLARFVLHICKRTTSVSVSQNVVSCEGDCCGGPSRKSCVQTESQSQINFSSSKAGDNDLLSYNTFMYTALRGFRSKLQIHSVVFNDHVLPEINRYISKLGRKLGQKQCEAVLKVIGDRMPACFQDINI